MFISYDHYSLKTAFHGQEHPSDEPGIYSYLPIAPTNTNLHKLGHRVLQTICQLYQIYRRCSTFEFHRRAVREEIREQP